MAVGHFSSAGSPSVRMATAVLACRAAERTGDVPVTAQGSGRTGKRMMS